MAYLWYGYQNVRIVLGLQEACTKNVDECQETGLALLIVYVYVCV